LLSHLQKVCHKIQSPVSKLSPLTQHGSSRTDLEVMARTVGDIVFGSNEDEVFALAVCCYILNKSSDSRISAAKMCLVQTISKRLSDDIDDDMNHFCSECLQFL